MDEPAEEDQPPAHRARLEILCKLVHGNLDHGDDMCHEATDIKQLIQAANGSFSLRILEEAASVEADLGTTKWDNYWTLWWQKNAAEQVPPGLTADQVLTAKKVELGTLKSAECMRSWRESDGADILSSRARQVWQLREACSLRELRAGDQKGI